MIDLTSQAGQEFDRETGLNNYRARMYDTDLKRFYSTITHHTQYLHVISLLVL